MITQETILVGATTFVLGFVARAKLWWNIKPPSEKKAAAKHLIEAAEDGKIDAKEVKDFIDKFVFK